MYSLRVNAARLRLLLFSSARAVVLSLAKLSSVMSQSLKSCLRFTEEGMRVPSFTWKVAMLIALMSFLILSTSAVDLGGVLRDDENIAFATLMQV